MVAARRNWGSDERRRNRMDMAAAPQDDRIVFEPALDTFEANFAAGRSQVVWTRLVADLETPVSAYMKLARAADARGAGNAGMSFLLESVEGGIDRGRYSIIGLTPDLVWRADGERAEINRSARQRSRRLRTTPPARRWRPCGRCWRNRRSRFPANCRRWPPASSATWATTRSAWSSTCPTCRRTRSACPTPC